MNSRNRYLILSFLGIIFIILFIEQKKGAELLLDNGNYTIGKVIKKRIVAGAGPTYVYKYKVRNKTFLQEGGGRGFKGYENKYYFVIFNPNNPKESEVLINFKVPDSIKEAPENGWEELPVPHTKEEILKGIK